MALKLTVKHRDGSESRTTIYPATEVAFEEHFGKSWTEAFSEAHPFQGYLHFCAWHSLHDDGKTGLDFKAWLKTLATLEVESPEETAPLDQEAPRG